MGARLRRRIFSLVPSKSALLKPRVGNWSAHISQWANLPGSLIVRYEDLSEEPDEWLKAIARHLGRDVSDEAIGEVVRSNSFSKKKEQYMEQGSARNVQHLRRGQVGDWVRFFSNEIRERVDHSHREAMQTFRYLSKP